MAGILDKNLTDDQKIEEMFSPSAPSFTEDTRGRDKIMLKMIFLFYFKICI